MVTYLDSLLHRALVHHGREIMTVYLWQQECVAEALYITVDQAPGTRGHTTFFKGPLVVLFYFC